MKLAALPNSHRDIESGIPRWKSLYDNGMSNKDKRVKNYLVSAHEKIITALKECTFKPHIKKQSISYHARKASFYKRVLAWNGEKNEKIRKERSSKLEHENQICTFRPEINEISKIIVEKQTSDEVFANPNIYGDEHIKKHIERSLEAQFYRYIKNEILTNGKPPNKKLYKLIKSASANKFVPTSANFHFRAASKDKGKAKQKSKKYSRSKYKTLIIFIKPILKIESSKQRKSLSKRRQKSSKDLVVNSSRNSSKEHKISVSINKSSAILDEGQVATNEIQYYDSKEFLSKNRQSKSEREQFVIEKSQTNSSIVSSQGSQGQGNFEDSKILSKEMSSLITNEEFFLRKQSSKKKQQKNQDNYDRIKINQISDVVDLPDEHENPQMYPSPNKNLTNTFERLRELFKK